MVSFDAHDKKASPLAKIRAVVHDSESKWLRMLALELEAMGLKTVHQAKTPKEVLTLILDLPIDVIVTHWDKKLIALLRRSKKNPRRKIPIILVTSGLQKQMILEARDLGIDELVAKPASAKQIYDHIENVITNRRPFIDAENFIGPDRRRRQKAELEPQVQRPGIEDRSIVHEP